MERVAALLIDLEAGRPTDGRPLHAVEGIAEDARRGGPLYPFGKATLLGRPTSSLVTD